MTKSRTMKAHAIAVIVLFAGSLLTTPAAYARTSGWVAGWARAMRSEDEPLQADDVTGAVIRTYVPLSAGGTKVRLRFSNRFGRAPLVLSGIQIARPDGEAGQDHIEPASAKPVTFGGKLHVTIPAGAYFDSDPVDMRVAGLGRLAVTFHMPADKDNRTLAAMPKGVTFVAAAGRGDEASLPASRTADRVFQLSAVSVYNAPQPTDMPVAGTIAILGDSITDAGGASSDWRGRWTDVLARRLQANPATKRVGLANLGTSGGRVARDKSGPSALARLDQDVLSLPDLRTLIVFLGVNDIGMMPRERVVSAENRAAVVDEVIEGYRQIIERAHDRGARVIVIPILPFGGVARSDYLADAEAQQARHTINAWARAGGHFDGVIDLENLMRDPAAPDDLNPQFDRGDHLHPSANGQEAMGQAIPLDLLH